MFFTRCDVFCYLLQYTRTEKYLFYSIKIQTVYCRILRGIKKEKQAYWHNLSLIWCQLSLCPIIDYDQQPMKVHTEVTLLYKFLYVAPETMYPITKLVTMKCDVLRLLCQAPLLSNTILDSERGHEVQKWKITFRKPRFVNWQRFLFLLCNTLNLCSKTIFGATCWNSGGSL